MNTNIKDIFIYPHATIKEAIRVIDEGIKQIAIVVDKNGD